MCFCPCLFTPSETPFPDTLAVTRQYFSHTLRVTHENLPVRPKQNNGQHPTSYRSHLPNYLPHHEQLPVTCHKCTGHTPQITGHTSQFSGPTLQITSCAEHEGRRQQQQEQRMKRQASPTWRTMTRTAATTTTFVLAPQYRHVAHRLAASYSKLDKQQQQGTYNSKNGTRNRAANATPQKKACKTNSPSIHPFPSSIPSKKRWMGRRRCSVHVALQQSLRLRRFLCPPLNCTRGCVRVTTTLPRSQWRTRLMNLASGRRPWTAELRRVFLAWPCPRDP